MIEVEILNALMRHLENQENSLVLLLAIAKEGNTCLSHIILISEICHPGINHLPKR